MNCQCGTGGVLFYLPGAWEGGLCRDCAETTAPERFRDYFGTEIRHVSDGDAGHGHAASK